MSTKGKVLNMDEVLKLEKCYFPFTTIEKLIQHANHKLDTYGNSPNKYLCHAVSTLWSKKNGSTLDTIIKACEVLIDTPELKKQDEVWGTNRVNSDGVKNSALNDVNGHASTMYKWYGLPVYKFGNKYCASEELTTRFYTQDLQHAIDTYMSE